MTTPNDVLRAMRRAAWEARENAMPERVRIVYSERFAEDDAQVSIMLRAALAEAERQGFVLASASLVKTLSDELAHWVCRYYVSERTGKVHPDEEADFTEAMKPVYEARAMLAAAPRWEP